METNSVSRRYETRSRARAEEPVVKSRVDWKRTKRRSTLLDSEEEDSDATSTSEKELETSSEEEVGEEEGSVVNKCAGETVVDGGGHPDAEAGCQDTATEEAEDESINLGKRKRSRQAVMYDSDDSDESDIVRKVFAKRSCVIDEEDLSADHGPQTSPAEEEANRKKQRLRKLQELSQRRPTQTRRGCEYPKDTDNDEIASEDSCQSPLTPVEVSDTSESDSMKDFIVDDEEEEELEQEKSEDENNPQEKKQVMSSRPLDYHIPSLAHVDHFLHFQRVVRAFLINAIDNNFLISLYKGERQKIYAQEMLISLRFFDNRFVQPRLQNLISRSRWKDRYKERVDSYPDVRIVCRMQETRFCQACELQRYCKFMVILSGELYNSDTLEIDDFMSHDKQTLKVGAVCGSRTRVYHKLKHFKYKLYKECCAIMKNEGLQDEPAKDTVDRVFRQLGEDGWIRKQYTDLEDHMNNAELFQEEKLD